MTPEEIAKTITGMLAVQRELQESQIRQGEEIDQLLNLADRLIRLNVDRVTAELNLEERILNLAQRVERLENK
jgi:hypothetical protein